jgi:hypothetical protein
MREGKETARFLGHVLEVDKAKRLADDVEQIAMLPGGHVGLMLNCT